MPTSSAGCTCSRMLVPIALMPPPPCEPVHMRCAPMRRTRAPILSVGSGAHSHDHTGDRTGGRDLGAVPMRRLRWLKHSRLRRLAHIAARRSTARHAHSPTGHPMATLAAAKGRLIRCTVPGSTPNCLAMTGSNARERHLSLVKGGVLGGLDFDQGGVRP